MTHVERLQRRISIAEAVRRGALPTTVARKFGVCQWTVYKACREYAVPILCRQTTLRKRRRAMVDEVRYGKTPAVVAKQFHVSARTVHKACREHGIPLSCAPPTREVMLAMLAAMERGESHETIALQFRQHHTHVRKLYREAEAAGLTVRMPSNDFRGIRAPEPAQRPSESSCGATTAK